MHKNGTLSFEDTRRIGFPEVFSKSAIVSFKSPGDTISLVFVCLLFFFFFLTRSYNQDVSIRVNTASV